MTNRCFSAHCTNDAMENGVLCADHYEKLPAPMRGEQVPSKDVSIEWVRRAYPIDEHTFLHQFIDRLAHEPPAEPIGFVARSKRDGYIARDFAKPGECHALNDGFEWMPVHARPSPPPLLARPLNEWHEDMGDVVWWKFPVDEPAWIGSPLASDWPGYHTHWTPHPQLPERIGYSTATKEVKP